MTDLRPNPRTTLPFREQVCETGDDGAPVILLHGFGGDRQTWVNIQTGLASRKRSLAFDLPVTAKRWIGPRSVTLGFRQKLSHNPLKRWN
jgi:pimeloyl-ACP methyl ester carboxylesterase